MVIVVEVKGLPAVQKMLKGLERELPRGAQRGLQRIAQFGARQVMISAQRAGLNPSGASGNSIFTNTRAQKIGEDWVVVTPIQSIYQDRMRPHWVTIRKSVTLTKWAKQHGYKSWHIYTKPHPFLAHAKQVTGRNAKPIMEREINLAMKRAHK